MIVAVRLHGSDAAPLAVPSGRASIGSAPDCDLVVPGAAPAHATVEHADRGLRVTAIGDQPLYSAPWTPAVREVLVRPGGVCWVGNAPLVALDDSMTVLRLRLARSLGLDAHGAVDDALVAAGTREPLLVLGPRNLDDDALISALDGNVVVIDLDEPRALPAPQAARVFAPRRDSRLVLRATGLPRARSVLDNYLLAVRVVTLAPLASRPGEIARLLTGIWQGELRTRIRAEALGPKALRGLAGYRWPGNLTELRAHAPRLLAYHQRGGLRAAARALGCSHQSLADHFYRIGFPVRSQGDGTGDASKDPPLPQFIVLWWGFEAKPLGAFSERLLEMATAPDQIITVGEYERWIRSGSLCGFESRNSVRNALAASWQDVWGHDHNSPEASQLRLEVFTSIGARTDTL